MKKLLLTHLWLILTSVLIFVSFGAYNYYFLVHKPEFRPKKFDQLDQAQIHQDKTKREEVKGVESQVETADGRPEIVSNFLDKYNSPLKPHDKYGQMLVEIADKNQIDFRLLPAIMMEESNLCKNIPEGTYNCLGFGIHSRGTLGFDNYRAGFERAARELKANYIEEGRVKVSEIARKYTASVDKWTNSVNQWMAEMEYDDRRMGLEKKEDANVLEYVQPEK
mgnify:CR=1 FL=1